MIRIALLVSILLSLGVRTAAGVDYQIDGAVEFRIEGAEGLYCVNGELGPSLARSEGDNVTFRSELRRISRLQTRVAKQLRGMKVHRDRRVRAKAVVGLRVRSSNLELREASIRECAALDPHPSISDLDGAISVTQVALLEGGFVMGHDGVFLGILTVDSSVGNRFLAYPGTRLGTSSSQYIDSVSPLSAYTITDTPPRIFVNGRAVAFLTVNPALSPRLHPEDLMKWLGCGSVC